MRLNDSQMAGELGRKSHWRNFVLASELFKIKFASLSLSQFSVRKILSLRSRIAFSSCKRCAILVQGRQRGRGKAARLTSKTTAEGPHARNTVCLKTKREIWQPQTEWAQKAYADRGACFEPALDLLHIVHQWATKFSVV